MYEVSRKSSCQEDISSSPVKQVRVLVIDDSLVVRSILERIIGGHDGFELAGSLASAIDAVEFLKKNNVDIILLDIEMPDRCGLDALPDILAECGAARVMILSSACEEGGPAAMRALSLGACDTMAKPGRSSFAGNFSSMLIDRMQQLVRSNLNEGKPVETIVMSIPQEPQGQPGCIAIGASTGGIPAIHTFLENISPAIDAPMLLTQHLPETFLPFLVRQLQKFTDRRVMLGQQGMKLERSHIYVAPGHGHMTCERVGSQVRLSIIPGAMPSAYTPAVDPMLASVASVFGRDALAIIMSGMGQDGLLGVEKMAAQGAQIFVQDAQTSVVWGMPGVVARAGFANAIMPVDRMARHINQLQKAVI